MIVQSTANGVMFLFICLFLYIDFFHHKLTSGPFKDVPAGVKFNSKGCE